MRKKLFGIMIAVVAMGAMAIPTFAADPDTVDVMKTAFEGLATNLINTIAVILPIALGIFAATFAVKFGFKFFKRITGSAT